MFRLFAFLISVALVLPHSAMAQTAPATAEEKPRFDILEYEVDGNSVLAAVTIERVLTPFLGPNRNIDDVESARAALEKAYQSAGWLTVTVLIPEQKVEDGVVRLEVTEGRVDRLRITGSRYFALGEIRARVPTLAEGGVPNFGEVQRQLATLNRTEDRRVQPVLRAGRTPGTVEVDLQVQDRFPLHGDLELNNRASANTKPLRLSGNLRYDNLWQRDHSAGISFQTTPQDFDQVRVWSGTYVIPRFVTPEGALALYAVRSASDVAAIGTLNVLGRGNIFGARWIIPIEAGEGVFRSLSLGLDYKDFKDDINLAAGGFSTPISYGLISAQFTNAFREKSGAATQLGTSVFLGPRGLFGTSDLEFEQKRARAAANFFIARAEVSRLQPIAGRFSAFVRADGQLASGALVSNEQYFAGGADTVRGYREAEDLGDDGARASLELRYGLLDPAKNSPGLDEAFVFAFADGARLRTRETLPEQRQRATLASAGVGFRLRAWRSVRLWGDVARVMRDGPFTQSGDWRVLFRLGYAF